MTLRLGSVAPMKLSWSCDHCSAPLGAGDVVQLALPEVKRALEVVQERQRTIVAEEMNELLLDKPGGKTLDAIGDDLAREGPIGVWEATCLGCRPDAGNEGGFVKTVREIKSLPQLIWINVDLHEKIWLPGSDWPDFLLRQLGSDA